MEPVSTSTSKMMVCRLLVIASILATAQVKGECLDWLRSGKCKALAREGGCVRNKTLMHDNCCQTCMKYNTTTKISSGIPPSVILPTGVLQPTASTKTWIPTASTKTWIPTQPHRRCLDWLSRSKCKVRAEEGGCLKDKKIMHEYCCHTCMAYNTTPKPSTTEAPTTAQLPTTLGHIDEHIDGTWGNGGAYYMTIELEDNGQHLVGTFCTGSGSSYDLRGGISLGTPASIGFTVTIQGDGKPASTTSWAGQYRLVNNRGVLYTTWIQTTPTDGNQSMWASTHTGKDVFRKLEIGFTCPSIVVL